jgi:HD-like signal output (HDOD) protein
MATARKFIERFKETTPLPSILTTINRLIDDPESTMKDFEEVIKMDQVMVSRLLRLVNSPFYGLLQKVDSISRAVAYLGMKNLHQLVVVDSMHKIFRRKSRRSSFSKKKLWMHSATVAICNKMVAERIFGLNGDDVFLCGILHDFGLLVEEQADSKKMTELCSNCPTSNQLIEQERQMFGTDHGEIGCLLAVDWNMPTNIQDAIRDHHLLMPEIDPASPSGILQISEFIAGRLGEATLPGMAMQISPPLLAHLQENGDEYTVLIEDLPEELAKAQEIYG